MVFSLGSVGWLRFWAGRGTFKTISKREVARLREFLENIDPDGVLRDHVLEFALDLFNICKNLLNSPGRDVIKSL